MNNEKQRAIETLVWSVAVLATLISASIIGFTFGNLSDPLERTYAQYNHIRMFEDGSYIGETLDGEKVVGCVKHGLCQDGVQ